jgi:hypothetical protein
MTYYNFSNMSTGEFDFIAKTSQINDMANGMIGLMILISLFLIILISLKNYETKRSFAAASFITLIVSILLNFIGFVQIYFTVVLICMTIAGWIMIKSEDS